MMKVLFITLLTIINGASALACVGFNGAWKCDNNQVLKVVVEKTAAGYILRDQVSKISLILDNAPHNALTPVPHSYQGYCTDTTLEVAVNFMGNVTNQKLVLTSPTTVVASLSAAGQSGTYNCAK